MTVTNPRLYVALMQLQHLLGPRLGAPVGKLRWRLYRHDFLTGLYNRVAFAKRVNAALAEGKTGALVYLDVDHFKYVNDTWGHVEGDACIQHLAGLLRETAAGRLLGRIGGDEFGVYTELSSEAADLAERIRSRVERDRRFEEKRVLVPKRISPAPDAIYAIPVPGTLLTVTVGVAHAKPGSTFDELLRAADEAQHSAKKAGRNRVAVAGTSLQASIEQPKMPGAGG
jgi:diguanylate cyclase